MCGRMIYFDRRVYTQCALITKILIADRLETPVAFDNGQVLIEAVIISVRDTPRSRPHSRDRCACRVKIIRVNLITIYSGYSDQIWLDAGNIRIS